MTDERRAQWLEYVRHVARLMERTDWRIEIPDEPAEDAHADCWIQDNHQYARIRLKEDWESESPEEQRYTVVHELLHLHFECPSNLMYDLQPFMSEREFTMFHKIYQDAFERSIDTVAHVLAPHMPLPARAVSALRRKPSLNT